MMTGHRRRSLRLRSFDYSQPGACFATICVQHRACLFGNIVDSTMVLNAAGSSVLRRWKDLEGRFRGLETDAVVVMSNHLHDILLASGDPDDPLAATHQASLGTYVQWFKSIITHDYMDGVRTDQWPPFNGRLWQRNYYEHVIRNDRDLGRIRVYIEANPWRWSTDAENPDNHRS